MYLAHGIWNEQRLGFVEQELEELKTKLAQTEREKEEVVIANGQLEKALTQAHESTSKEITALRGELNRRVDWIITLDEEKKRLWRRTLELEQMLRAAREQK